MPKGNIFVSRSNDQLGAMSFELTSIYASGGPDFPTLNIRADIALSRFRQGSCKFDSSRIQIAPRRALRIAVEH
jgi:hypothetical protein